MRPWTKAPKFVQCLSKQIVDRGPHWHPADVLDRETTPNKDLRYSEFVYFHPFVQRVLYPCAAEPNPALAILGRNDITGVEVTLGGKQQPLTMDVKRVHLYLFRSETALLVTEVASRGPLPLPTVLEFADQFRRAYSPYHSDGSGGHCPERVKWISTDSSLTLNESNYLPEHMHRTAFDPAKRRTPIAAHWLSLLTPLKPVWEAGPADIAMEQLEDDRIPTMLYAGIADPFSLGRGDFMRICFCDGEWAPNDLPYAQAFLKDFEKKYCYDRFWNPPDPNGPGSEFYRRQLERRFSRYLCNGNNFAVVTKPDGYGDIILKHFRHHYFQIGLLAHFHRASLLKYSRRLTDEVPSAVVSGDGHWDALIQVRRQFADFLNEYWFREISNQDQAKELFQWWSERLGNKELLDQLSAEAMAVDRILNQERDRKQEAFQIKQQQEVKELQASTDRLTKAIFWLAGLTVIVAFLDTEMMRDFARHGASWFLLFLDPRWCETFQLWWPLGWNIVWAALGILILWFAWKKMFKDRDKRHVHKD